MPRFIVDLKSVDDRGFARLVLQKTLSDQGGWTDRREDHRYNGIDNAWIRYVSRGTSEYRVIYIRVGENVYLYRAGRHSVEDRLAEPRKRDYAGAVRVDRDGNDVDTVRKAIDAADGQVSCPTRFLRSIPDAEIHRRLVGRRNLPHKEIWLVSPVVNPALLSPTASIGGVLAAQIEDGARVSVVTSLPHDENIAWMEELETRSMTVFVHPRLHAKLYCFMFDEERRFVRGVPEDASATSLIVVGSADLTAEGVGGEKGGNVKEELCYLPPEEELEFVEGYLLNLIEDAFELVDVRRLLARRQADTLTGVKS